MKRGGRFYFQITLAARLTSPPCPHLATRQISFPHGTLGGGFSVETLVFPIRAKWQCLRLDSGLGQQALEVGAKR